MHETLDERIASAFEDGLLVGRSHLFGADSTP
jgi:hypothetical protein